VGMCDGLHGIVDRLNAWLTLLRSYDGKAKIWSLERRDCVATQTESEKCLWAVRWLPKSASAR